MLATHFLFRFGSPGGNSRVMSESQMLDDFARTRSDGAFGAIVRLHLNMVLATALRQVGDRGAAEEIAQSVFLLLAQKAGSLRGDTTVGGWLYKATLNLCRERMRSDLRRRRREEAAAEINAIVMSGESTWSAIMPLLDEALLSLQEADRLAVILHFMEEQTFREVGHALGVGEDAARKRVNRVVDELSRWFQKRGVALPAGGITAALGLGSIQAASPALAGSIVSACCAAPLAGSLFEVFMASTKVKLLAGAALLAIGVTLPTALKPEPAATVGAATAAQNDSTPATIAPVRRAAEVKSLFQRLSSGDMSFSMLSHGQADAYLERNQTNAESLIIAYRVTHDAEYLRRAVAAYPTNNNVLFRALIHDIEPEKRRELLDRYKEADPGNALPHFFSAADHLTNGRTDEAIKDLAQANIAPSLRDDITEQLLNLEEIYHLAGYSHPEAKAIAMNAVEMPHVSELVKLSKAVNELVAQRYQSGLVDQGDNLATMGLNISHRLREIQDGGNLLGEMTGTFVERNFLRQLDPAKAYPFLKYDIRERLGQLDQEEARIRADSQLIEKWMDSANESEIVNYYDRLKVYGEAAALEWLRKRNPE